MPYRDHERRNEALRQWHKRNPGKQAIYYKKHYAMNSAKIRLDQREYYDTNKEAVAERQRKYRVSVRHKGLLIVGRGVIRCVNCGCDREELLQINHKSGGGRKEGMFGPLAPLVVSGKRSVEDLELTCAPCNSLHYLELKYGKLPMKIIWDGEPE